MKFHIHLLPMNIDDPKTFIARSKPVKTYQRPRMADKYIKALMDQPDRTHNIFIHVDFQDINLGFIHSAELWINRQLADRYVKMLKEFTQIKYRGHQ